VAGRNETAAGCPAAVKWSAAKLRDLRTLDACSPSALRDLELHLSPSARLLKPALDGAVVDEDVLPPLLNEAVPFASLNHLTVPVHTSVPLSLDGMSRRVIPDHHGRGPHDQGE